MSWLAPAIVSTLSGSVILAAVFLYLYTQERARWMLVWGIAWLAYSVRFSVDLYQVVSQPSAALTLISQLLVLFTGILLLDGSHSLAGRQTPRWPWLVGAAVAVWTIVAMFTPLSPFWASLAVWTFRGAANIAAGFVWYRSVTQSGPWGRITGVTFIIWGLHHIDYPFLRGVEAFAPIGFMLGAFLEFIIAFGALIAHFERTRHQLSESEARYRALFEDSASVMWIIDPADGRVVHVNEAAISYYGWTAEQFSRMNVAQVNTLSPDEIKAEMARVRSKERSMFNFRHRLASGEVRDVEVYASAVRIDGRDLLYSIVHDVTDRTRAERELRESEERYSTLFEDSLSPMLLISGEGARILDANEAAARMYGWPIASLTQMGIADLSVDDQAVIEREVAETISAGGRVGYFIHRRADGSKLDVEVYSTPISSGDGVVLYTIVNDISARVEAETRLAEY